MEFIDRQRDVEGSKQPIECLVLPYPIGPV